MKKVFLALLLMIFALATPVFAGTANKTIIAATTLDDDPTSATGTWNIQDYKEVGFWVNYDETQVGNAVSVDVTLDISYDGTTWLDANFYDIAGGTTLQTSETISADGWYYCTLPTLYNPAGSIIYVRIAIAATNTDTDDTAAITAYLVGTK